LWWSLGGFNLLLVDLEFDVDVVVPSGAGLVSASP